MEEIKINVNLFDYLAPERVQAIVIEEFRNTVRRFMHKEIDLERILTNVSYDIVFNKIAEVTKKSEAELEKTLTEKVIKGLDVESIKYQIFRGADSYCGEGVANPLLRKIVAESEGLMKETVEKAIKDYNFTNVKDAMLDMVYQVIEEKLFSKKGE